MLIYSMGVSVDGYIADREGAFGWTVPDDELFAFHLAQVGQLGGYLLGRRLYETMLVWETDPVAARGRARGRVRSRVPNRSTLKAWEPGRFSAATLCWRRSTRRRRL